MQLSLFISQLLCCVVLVLAVNRPPHIYIQPTIRDIFYKPGESVEMPCVANGIPDPIYRWKRNGEDYNPSGQDGRVVQLPRKGTIVFSAPEDKDEGIFQCFADNGYGVSASVKINFREAKLASFAYEERQTHTADAGETLTLPCVPPVSYPSADVYWVIKEPDSRWQAINFDKRVSMDLEGRLRFTNVRKSDEHNGKAYSCMAINYFMRDNAMGPEHVVSVLGTTEQKRPTSELWTSPADQAFVKGGTMRLKCIFGGNPTPDVYWRKTDGPLPDRAKFKSFGQELMITDLQLSDEGEYVCEGYNTESSQQANKGFTIRIESGPYWIDEPESAEKGVGESATFLCKAGGTPEPTYFWYINGVPYDKVTDPRINNSPRVFRPTTNNLTITDLSLEDYMVIQCNATNKHNYLFADFFLNVLAEKPTIIVPPPPHIKVAEGQSVTITCTVTGKPDPIITWYRDTSLITGGRFKILPNGDLLIQNVVMADAGDYRCQASNIYAKDVTSSVCKMQIRRKTRIEQAPLDLEVIAGYNAKFICSGSTDFDETRNMRVYWEKDGKLVSTNEQRMSQNYQDNSLTISGTIVRDSGVYTCVITNGLDEDRAFAILTVKDKPDPPSGVIVERCRQSSADIRWTKGIENNAPVQYFIVQYNTSFNADQWVSAKTVEYTQNTANIELQPWSNYTFRVLATNKIGASSSSFPTGKVCRTDPEQPYSNPKNVRAIGNRRNSLVLEWIPMNPPEHNGPGFKYQLTVKERGMIETKTFIIDNWRNNSVSIDVSNKVYTPYLVKLQAKNNVGDSREDPIEKTLYSYEDIPKGRVTNVGVTNISANTANVVWTWQSNWLTEEGAMQSILGEFKGFKVQYWRTNEKLRTFREVDVYVNEILPKDVPSTGTIVANYRLQNLPPYSRIEIQVCLMNNFYVGGPSEIIGFNTFEGVPGPVRNFEARVRSSNSFTLVWSIPAPEDRHGLILGYDIGYQFVNGLQLGAFHDRDEQIDDPTATFAVLSGLLPNRMYRVHIYARTIHGRGEGTYIHVSTTDKAVIGAPEFKIGEVGETFINVTWAPGPSFGAHVVHYVEYRREGAADWQQSADVVIRSYKEIINLEKGTYYEIRVVAYDGMNRAFSETKVAGTVGFAAARAIAANYGWFIGMLISGVAFIVIVVFIYLIHRRRKDVEEKPKGERHPVRSANDFDRDSRGQYNDYYKEDSYEGDYNRDSYDDRYKPEEPAPVMGYKNHDYEPKHGGYDDYRKDDYRKDDYDRDYDRDYDNDYDRDRYPYDDDDYDRDYDDRDRDRDYDRDQDYDRDYDKRKNRRDDDYSDEDAPVHYDAPPPKYERTLSDDRYDDDDKDRYEEYQREPSKFDEDGNPRGGGGDKAGSTFV